MDNVGSTLESGNIGVQEQKKKLGCLSLFGFLCLTPITITLTTVMEGFTLSFLWGWFLVPLGLPNISVIHAFGIALTARFFSKRLKTPKRKEKKKGTDEKLDDDKITKEAGDLLYQTFVYVTACGLTILIGFIVHKLM